MKVIGGPRTLSLSSVSPVRPSSSPACQFAAEIRRLRAKRALNLTKRGRRVLEIDRCPRQANLSRSSSRFLPNWAEFGTIAHGGGR